MLLEAILHKTYSEYAFPIDENTLVLRIRTKKDEIKNVLVVFHEKFDPSMKDSVSMVKIASDELFDYYEAKLSKNIKRFKYMFYLEAVFEHKWLCAGGFSDERPEEGHFTFSNISKGDIISIPKWFKDAVIYQVFPDRFCNPGYGAASLHNRARPQNKADLLSFFGGTIKGIIEKIEYIKELGINTLYLNPVFKANSYHRYDTVDYYKIDPLLGTNEEFKKLVEICHENKIRVVLDAVFNHCSRDFFAFKDVIDRGKDSIYRDWFIIEGFPLKQKPKPNYECFGFFGGMPKFNTLNKKVQEYFTGAAAFWIDNYNIDGFRFDAADEVDHDFWRLMRDTIKERKSDAVLIGEIWDQAYPWLCGDQFDSVLNYPLKELINDLVAFKSINEKKFRQKLSSYLFGFNSKVVNSLVNIIGTHDTPRFMTLCNDSVKRFELGVVLQFTLPGIPLIYYGDEIGMRGETDPYCREPMVWDEFCQNKGIFSLYKFLIDLRKENSLPFSGSYKEVKVFESNRILAYRRSADNEGVIIVINVSDKSSRGVLHIESGGSCIQKLISLKNEKTHVLESQTIKTSLGPYEWDIYRVEIIGKLV